MRYDTQVKLIRIIPGRFDPKTANREGDREAASALFASAMDTGAQAMQLVYGKLVQDSLTLQFQNHLPDEIDMVEVDGRRYCIDRRRRLRTKETLIVSQVQT